MDNNRVYVVDYLRGKTGARLSAYSALDGSKIWRTDLEAIGPISHTIYSSRVQVRILEGDPVVYGSEESGAYIERRDAATGKLISNEKLEAKPLRESISYWLYRRMAEVLHKEETHTISLRDFATSNKYQEFVDTETHILANLANHTIKYLDGLPVYGTDTSRYHAYCVSG